MQTKIYETDYCGKKLKAEISDLADQANGSVLVRYGETVVFATAVMGGKNDSDIPAIIAASLALGISDIPWGGPVGAARVGQIDGQFVFNPTYEEREKSAMDIAICAKDGKVNMIEAGAKEIAEEIAVKGIESALAEIAKMEEFQKKIIKEIGKEKIKIEIKDKPKEAVALFEKNILPKLEAVLYNPTQSGQKRAKPDIDPLKKEWAELLKTVANEEFLAFADEIFEDGVDELVRNKVIDAPKGQEKRPDGRRTDEVRSLHASVDLLPALHGSAVFYRRHTHILSTVTLGGPQDAQLIEGMEVQTIKHFMHHYNFPPFSVGETGRMGSPGRREIGHGALVEKALLPVLPPKSDFPYTIRVVSEAMASNGSTSQGSICASTLALMDAGVPIKNPVAGIS